MLDLQQQSPLYTAIPLERIVVRERKRALGDITQLAQSIKEIGLLNPLTVLSDGTLVAGYHRLEACKSLGWQEIEVRVVSLDALNAELAEIDENLIRNELHWFDRDKQLARRKEIYKSLKRQGEICNDCHIASDTVSPSFVQDTIAKTGVSDRTIERSIQRATAFTEEQGEVLKRVDVKPTDATKLARLEQPKREAVLQVLATGKATNVKDAATVVRQEEKQQVYEQTVIAHDDCQIYHCSVAELHVRVNPESLDVIITDPPYPYEYLSVYDELAHFAQYALKPGGSLIAMVGQSYLPDILSKLCACLTYHWTACYLTPGGQSAQLWQRKVNTFWKPLLWFTKGDYTGAWVGDVCKSTQNDKEHHHWGQSEGGIADILERFTLPGQLICDPFVGGGTTASVAIQLKRRFIGCDVDTECVTKTLTRVSEVLA